MSSPTLGFEDQHYQRWNLQHKAPVRIPSVTAAQQHAAGRVQNDSYAYRRGGIVFGETQQSLPRLQTQSLVSSARPTGDFLHGWRQATPSTLSSGAWPQRHGARGQSGGAAGVTFSVAVQSGALDRKTGTPRTSNSSPRCVLAVLPMR